MQNKASKIIESCLSQNKKFKQWASKQAWHTFHQSHYDWWAFPIDAKSASYKQAYQVTQTELNEMIKNQQFITALRNNAVLVCESWGWDLEKGRQLQNKKPFQKWQRWPIRLSKMCRSLQIFRQMDLFENCIKYSILLLKQYKTFKYSGQDLTPYFYNSWEEIEKRKKAQS